ncbi:N-acyl homoserine lactonase family protein [Paenarthrobacter sp. NPDC089714]|uniref:N-acyl homoserine lactonase family protein n=1 Tax=Paenarthrobacter sp. NPDC089714 TaxID=3364377 RepID=UPI00382FCA7D
MSESHSPVRRVIAIEFGLRESLKSEVHMSYQLYGQPDGEQHTTYYFWLIEHEQGPILVDTGFYPEGGERRKRQMNRHPVAALETLGVDAKDIRLVIMTHLHWDHAGNLLDFPNAEFVLAKSEREFWNSDLAKNKLFSAYFDPEAGRDLDILESEGRLRYFSGVAEPVPGVRVLEVGGHSPGQSIVEIDTRDGVLLLTSDAVHFNDTLEKRMPFCSMTDLPTGFEVFDMIESRLESGTYVDVVTGHDPVVATKYPPVDAERAPFAVVLSPKEAA